jgi:integrase
MGRRSGLPVVFLRPESDVYQYRFTVGGKRYRGSTGARDLGAAAAAAEKLHAEATLGRRPASQRRVGHAAATSLEVLFGHFVRWAKAQGKAPGYADKFESHFRCHWRHRWQRIVDLDGQAIERYKVERTEAGISSVTLHKELVTISRFLRWAVKAGHLAERPQFDRVKPISDYAVPYRAPDQMRELLAALPDAKAHPKRCPVREFYTVQWAQALRPGEVCTLRWSDVDLVSGTLTVRQSNDKAREGRTIALASESRAVLARLAKANPLPTSLVFGRVSYRRTLSDVAGDLGLGVFTPHHLRHARLSELASATRDVAAVQYLAGHKSLLTTDRYVRSRTERTGLVFDEVTQAARKVGHNRHGSRGQKIRRPRR